MLQRLLILTQAEVVVGGAAVQLIQARVFLDLQAAAEKILQQGVKTKPARLIVHRQQKQLALSQLFQQQRRATSLHHMIAKRAIKALEQATAQQEFTQVRRQLAQHDMAEVIDDFWLAAVKALQRLSTEARIGQQGNLHPRHPAFGHAQQAVDIRLTQRLTAQVSVELLYLLDRQTQVMLINTQQTVFQFQLAQGKAWVITAGDDQVDMGRQLVEQRRHHLKNAARLDPLKIIQHDKQRPLDPRQGISEQITQQLRRQAGSYRQRVEPGRIEIGHLGANVVSQTTEKTQWVAVPRLQRVMHHHRSATAAPVLQQRRLSRAGWGQQ